MLNKLILLTISSCSINKEVTNNQDENSYNNRNIYFIGDKWEKYSIEYDKLNINNIPEKISLIHFWHKLSSWEMEKIFTYNLNFIDSPEIIFSYDSINENIHKIFTELDIDIFNWVIFVYGDCRKWINIWKDISNMYFDSKINQFSIYTVCSKDISIHASCIFEWEEENQGKVICG